MPIIKSAIKKLRQDKKKTSVNAKVKKNFLESLKKVRKSTTKATIAKAYAQIDKAAKKNLIHKNKARRLKSHAAKLSKKAK